MTRRGVRAAADQVRVNGPKNGLPASDALNLSLCHGPHMHEEWWLGPPSGDAYDTPGWRRPFRRFKAAPHDAFLMAPPATFQPGGKIHRVGPNFGATLRIQ